MPPVTGPGQRFSHSCRWRMLRVQGSQSQSVVEGVWTMPPPFHGMDPFIEGYDWEDFHSRLIQGISDALVPQVRPRYVVRIEWRVYVEHDPGEPYASIRPDVSVAARVGPADAGGSASAITELIGRPPGQCNDVGSDYG